MIKVYAKKDMVEKIYEDSKLIGYIEKTDDGFQRELMICSKYKIVFI